MTTSITCSIDITDPESKLGLEIWLDNNKLIDFPELTHTFNFKHELDDEEGEHELRFVMKGKTFEHTTLNEAGEIIKDSCLTISNLAFDGIELNQLFIDNAVYVHDFNGTKDQINDKFYGIMGCNGSVSLKFATPVYLWLLENM